MQHCFGRSGLIAISVSPHACWRCHALGLTSGLEGRSVGVVGLPNASRQSTLTSQCIWRHGGILHHRRRHDTPRHGGTVPLAAFCACSLAPYQQKGRHHHLHPQRVVSPFIVPRHCQGGLSTQSHPPADSPARKSLDNGPRQYARHHRHGGDTKHPCGPRAAGQF